MSTEVYPIFPTHVPEPGSAISACIAVPQAEEDLFRPEHLARRLALLDQLDASIGHSAERSDCADPRVIDRMKALWNRLEAANQAFYEDVRDEIVRTGDARRLRAWLEWPEGDGTSASPEPGPAFDFRDEIVSGVLQFREPEQPELARTQEMIPYQPTPARHILDLIAKAGLSSNDILMDIGSGMGHVPLLVSILTGCRTVGVELQPAYVASAQECAQRIAVDQTRFVAADAREADLSSGTVFYLYSPFTGSILTDVLEKLRKESANRQIRICSLGPCTCVLKCQSWLSASEEADAWRIAVFESR